MPKILIAEDEIALSNILTIKLRDAGFTVVQAKNGQEAINLFFFEKPDLVLLDIIMPEKNGYEVLKEIKKSQRSSTPVIILSNLDLSQDIETGTALGAVEYIIKSDVSLKTLTTKIQKLLGVLPIK